MNQIIKRNVLKKCSLEEYLISIYLPKKVRNTLVSEKRIYKENDASFLELSTVLEKGDVLIFDLSDYEVNDIVPVKRDIDIVYEDSDIILVNKNRGILIHSDGNSLDTLTNRLSYYLNLKVRCIHRIDFDTTGLVLFSKNILSYYYLNHQMENGEIKKQYIAVVSGYLKNDSGEINLNIGSDRHHNNRYVVSKNGKSALTLYKVLERKNNKTKVLVTIKTGRTHQIRVHFAYLGHSLVGDKIYGKGDKLLLHSYLLGFIHPKKQKYQEYKVPFNEEYNLR